MSSVQGPRGPPGLGEHRTQDPPTQRVCTRTPVSTYASPDKFPPSGGGGPNAWALRSKLDMVDGWDSTSLQLNHWFKMNTGFRPVAGVLQAAAPQSQALSAAPAKLDSRSLA